MDIHHLIQNPCSNKAIIQPKHCLLLAFENVVHFIGMAFDLTFSILTEILLLESKQNSCWLRWKHVQNAKDSNHSSSVILCYFKFSYTISSCRNWIDQKPLPISIGLEIFFLLSFSAQFILFSGIRKPKSNIYL